MIARWARVRQVVVNAPIKKRAREDGAMAVSDLPPIGAPATRGLASVGITTLEQVADCSEAEFLAIHGVGPRSLRILHEPLAARGLSMRG
jgi:predicted flap endonuclease-1-like 5' DNA nuclease